MKTMKTVESMKMENKMVAANCKTYFRGVHLLSMVGNSL